MNGPRALTIQGAGILREIRSTVQVAEPSLDYSKPPANITQDLVAIWDTGATGSAITQSVVDELQIQPVTMTTVHGVHGQKTSYVYLVDLILPSNVGVRGLHVTLAQLVPDVEVLIGMDVITQGDFAITNRGGRTTMSFKVPPMIEIDFVKAPGAVQGTNREQRRAKVPGTKQVTPQPRRKSR